MENIRIQLPKKLYNKIEADVTELYIMLDLVPPLKSGEIARKLGFVVHKLSKLGCTIDEVCAAVGVNKTRNEGLSFFSPNIDTYVIVVNDVDIKNKERQDFTIMHEIGHIRMGHKVDSMLAEMIANYYAAYAFAPSVLIYDYQCEDFGMLIEVFNISEESAYYSFDRFVKWCSISGYKPYEIKLRKHIRAKRNC